MDGDVVRQQVAEIAEALYERTDELAAGLADAITREVRLYNSTAPVPFELVVHGCATNLRSVLSAIAAGTEFDPAPAVDLGIERARDGVPLASVMEAYRVAFRAISDAALKEVTSQPRVNGDVVRVLTTKILAAQDIFTAAMTAAYRDEQSRRLIGDESEREILIDSLLHGRLFEQWSIWEAADCLRLPAHGPYVVIAAESSVGTEALPGIESKLRSMDVFSAWQLLPDLHVGIVYVKNDKQLANVLALVSRMASNRVGVSAQFDDLRDTAQALRYARVTLRGRPDEGLRVTLFDGSILGTAAVSAPEVMVKLVAPTIECFAELTPEEREVLFETFRVWLENDGSLRTVGELLFCHPNTVRYRLHRIEQKTGRSLGRPRDVAELCLAFEVHRRLMWETENPDRPPQGR
ncbi:PucR family transcriptional regulator [Mycolicibacterium moriokaense]|uniref:PucR-like helix-turn-helix protein n=1 Tax=Mycolicibacterium moriokaense TaxID=39691 RepID=A0A318I0W8_9MYCO|nr:helix-turn-helix domain-containing protein [Mycolicibacterium moriokaense]PXX11933.1 PucR-like helix-turn-helix protein [Mycolicibacterium moriokaense]